MGHFGDMELPEPPSQPLFRPPTSKREVCDDLSGNEIAAEQLAAEAEYDEARRQAEAMQQAQQAKPQGILEKLKQAIFGFARSF